MELICDSVWPNLTASWKDSPRYIAVAYFSNDQDLSFCKNDLLIVDAADDKIASGQTDAAALERAFASGARIYSCQNLHAKIYVLGTKVFVGSANSSINSRRSLIECMLSSSDPHLISEAIKFVEALQEQSQEVNRDFLTRISKIEVKRSVLKRSNKEPVKSSPTRCWLLGMFDASYPGSEKEMEKKAKQVKKLQANKDELVEWFWWPINKRYRVFLNNVRVGDLIIQIYRPNRNNQETQDVLVYRHARICKITKERGVNAKVFHAAWPVDAERSHQRWDQFLSLAEKAGIGSRISINSCREISRKQSKILHELWEK